MCGRGSELPPSISTMATSRLLHGNISALASDQFFLIQKICPQFKSVSNHHNTFAILSLFSLLFRIEKMFLEIGQIRNRKHLEEMAASVFGRPFQTALYDFGSDTITLALTLMKLLDNFYSLPKM